MFKQCIDGQLHNFPYTNSECLNCGINQNSLVNAPFVNKDVPFAYTERPQEPHGHNTELQSIITWLYLYWDKKHPYGQIGGIVKRMGLDWGYMVKSIAEKDGLFYGQFMNKSKKVNK